MPNIDLQTLANIPQLDEQHQQQQMTQGALNGCGAYALTGAAGAHGAFPQQVQIAYGVNEVQIQDDNSYPEISDRIYGLTGILNPQRLWNLQASELVGGGGYNSPAALASVAMKVRRHMAVWITQAGFQVLAPCYPGEQQRCVNVVGQQNMHIGSQQDPVNYQDPGDNETHLICVFTNGGLHWIARGSDGLYYDPGNGTIGNNWGNPAAPAFQQNSSYQFGNLWLVVT